MTTVRVKSRVDGAASGSFDEPGDRQSGGATHCVTDRRKQSTAVSWLLRLVCATVCLLSWPTAAQVQDSTSIPSLRQELDALRERTWQLELKIGEVEYARTGAPPVAVTASLPSTAESLEAPGEPAWIPSQPILVMRSGQAYMNLSIGALATAGWSTATDPSEDLQLGYHDEWRL